MLICLKDQENPILLMLIFQKSKKIKEEKLFCSQFVAIVYKELGLIDRKMNVKNFVPVDFLGVDEDGQKNIVSNIFKICK